jgi:hypothetical protein
MCAPVVKQALTFDPVTTQVSKTVAPNDPNIRALIAPSEGMKAYDKTQEPLSPTQKPKPVQQDKTKSQLSPSDDSLISVYDK